MTTNELKQLLEDEKRALEKFIVAAEKFNLDPDFIEEQKNFYLERIFELMEKIKNIN
ncbi:hypothetical protein [Niabella sp.]|uniref:hypothetical protein n=1 Tax=Niabella sp. TaxID=1962976 RepID=UPI002639AE48|nr:hypothetical protein [Niabella sp.]